MICRVCRAASGMASHSNSSVEGGTPGCGHEESPSQCEPSGTTAAELPTHSCGSATLRLAS
eukprot:5658413-Prorocentrum_lima.AAC.1